MAEKNLTGALLELKDRERLRTQASQSTPPKPPQKAKSTLPYQARSFDTFYSFTCILLGVVILAQFAAIIIYS